MTMWPSVPWRCNAASAARITATGTPPASSIRNSTCGDHIPASVCPICSGDADCWKVFAVMYHSAGSSRRLMRSDVHSNSDCSSGDSRCQRAISVHSASLRFLPVIETAPIFGKRRVSRKFQASHAITVVLPGPLQHAIAWRG